MPLRYGLLVVATLAMASPGLAQTANPAATRSVLDGVYSAAQATRGAEIGKRECGACHGATLTEGAGEAPPLAGPDFMAEWNGYTAADLFKKMSETMPQTAPGSLTRQQYVDVLAQVLNLNKFQAGNAELGIGDDVLRQIKIEAAKP